MGNYDREIRAAERAQEDYVLIRRYEDALGDLRSGNRTLFVSTDDVRRRSRAARAKELVENAIDLLRLEVAELNDGFLKE